jgi:hypothetical protein
MALRAHDESPLDQEQVAKGGRQTATVEEQQVDAYSLFVPAGFAPRKKLALVQQRGRTPSYS